MNMRKKIIVLIVAAVFIALTFALPAGASTIVPLYTLQPIITGLIPLPTATPAVTFPTITSLIPIPTFTFEIIPFPVPVDILTSWEELTPTQPFFYPTDVVADRNRVKVLDWQNGGRLSIYDIESDTWYYLEPPASIGAMVFPNGMCEGEDSSVYIADTYKNRVLKCESNGSWSVVEDTGFAQPTDVTYRNGTLYVADTGNDRIRYLSEGVWKEMTKVGLNTTFDLLTDIGVKNGGGLLIADGGSDYVINRNAYNKLYSFVEHATYTKDYVKVYPDKDNNLYISCNGSDTVSKFNGTDFTLLMSSGTNIGQVKDPMGIFDDGLGDVYVADMGNNRVQKNKSSESSLSDLALDSATVQGFSPAVTDYTVSFPENKSSVNVSAFATSPYAVMSGDLGSRALSYGENIIEVKVKPEWGSEKIYTLTITRQEPTPTPSPTAEADTPTPEASPDASQTQETASPEQAADEGALPTTAAPSTPPDDTQTTGASDENGDGSETTKKVTSDASVPIWAIVVLTALVCGVLAVGGILIYMSRKNKAPKDSDFE